jgi:hypothetical protein
MTITQVFDKLVAQVLNPVIMPAILAQSRGKSFRWFASSALRISLISLRA